MAACTFFGHRDCPSSIKEKLHEEIERLISHHGVNTFYVGTQGNFDRMAYAALVELRKRYQHIKIYRVLAYMPTRMISIMTTVMTSGTMRMQRTITTSIRMIDSKQNLAIIVLIET